MRTSIADLVARQATSTPDAIAVTLGSEVVTYKNLNDRAEQLASALKAAGVGPEVPGAVFLPRSPEFVVAALAILKAGGAYVPLDPECPPERLRFILDSVRPRVVLTDPHRGVHLPGRSSDLIFVNQEFGSSLSPGSANVSTAPNHLAYIIYTSGSTGRPKGVQVMHASLRNLIEWHQRTFAVTAADRATHLANLAFDAAVWELWPYLTTGASVHIVEDRYRGDPELLRDWIIDQKITISFMPTLLAEHMMNLDWPQDIALRLLLTGGEIMHHYPPATLPFTVVNNYGLAETTVVASSVRLSTDNRLDIRPPIGVPIDNVQIHVLDDKLQPVSVGETGEIYVGGAALARGYINEPEQSMQRFIPNPFDGKDGYIFRTGDLGRYLPGGEIAFIGRIDDQLKLRGYRVEPEEIVTTLNQHPAISGSAVRVFEHECGDKFLVAYITVSAKTMPPAEELRDFLRNYLPDYMLPARFIHVDSLPVNSIGKIDYSALPEVNSNDDVRDASWAAPRTAVEKRLADILATLLNFKNIGANDNFFALGGHSLLGIQLISRLREAFEIDLPLRTLFDFPRVGDLAVQIEQLISSPSQPTDECNRIRAKRSH